MDRPRPAGSPILSDLSIFTIRFEGNTGSRRDGGARAPVGANISRDESSLQIDLSDLYSTVTASS